MNARDELATVIHRRICEDSLSECLEEEGYCVKAAGELIAAGYRKSRTITTAEELDALPGEVLVLTEQGGYWESIKRHDGKNWWKEPGGQNVSPSDDLTLPATVLHEGDAA